MERLWRDVRYGARTLGRTPGFTAVAVLTLALGIGANASMFSVIRATILGGLPYPEASRLVRIFRTSPQSQSWPHSAPNLIDYQSKSRAFAQTALFTWWTFNLAEPGQPPDRVDGLVASASFFDVLGMPPALGRVFRAEEDHSGQNDVVVLSHGFWRRRYAADPGVVGRVVRIDGRPTTIVGVMPAGADYPFLWGRVDVWRPLALTDAQRQDRSNNWLNAIGRLRARVSLPAADAEMKLLSAQLKKARSAEDDPDSVRVIGLLESSMDDVGHTVTWLTLGLAGFVLLIACANIANLQLARVAGRGHDYAVRAALGAGRARLLIQSLTESLLVGVAGGALGILVAWWGNGFLGRSIVIGDRSGVDIPLDWTILGFAVALSLAAGAASGLFPAWMATRTDVGLSLGGRMRVSSGRSQHRLRNSLIAGQMALALVLLSTSAHFVRGLRRFTERDPGWKMDGLLLGSLMLPAESYPDDDARRAFQNRLEDGLSALPGVEGVAVASSFPIWPYGSSTNLMAEGQPPGRGEQPPLLYYTRVSSGFFDALGIAVVRGSGLGKEIRADGPRVAVVNETAARRFWPNENPLGKRLGYAGEKPQWHEVIGVVQDVRFPASLGPPDTPLQVYVPLEQEPGDGWRVVAVRSPRAPEALAAPIRAAVAALHPDLPLHDLATPREHVRRALSSFGLAGDVLTAFSALGLLLAALGLYGVISNLVVQRTAEFGIRVALGAQVHEVIWLVLGKGLRLALVGTVIGLVCSIGLARFLAATLPSLPSEPSAIAGVALVLLIVAALACWLPARRAARVDPVVALRSE